MTNSKSNRIGQIPLLSGLNEAEVEALASRSIEKRYAAGERLFSEGEDCEGVFLILEGKVKIYKTSSTGREITLAIEPAPSSVAEVPLFDGGAYPASVAALEPVTAAFVHTREFQQLCRQRPEVSLKMLAAAGRRLRQLVSVIELVTFGSVRQRLAGVMLEFGREAGSDLFQLTSTHQELASRLGTVREVISRNMSRFQAEGLIRIKGRAVELRDPEGLRREAETEF